MTFSARSIKPLFGRLKPHVRPGNAVLLHPYWNHLTVILANWLALIDAISSQIAPYYVLNHIFFSANETALLKHSNQTNFKAYLKKSIKLQENERQNFATFYKPAHYTGSIKYLYSRKNYCIEWLNFAIQNRCDKVVIELRLLQLWTEIVVILVIWNQTCAARSFDLKSSVWFQTKLHFTQFNNHYFYIKRLWRRIDTSIQTHEVYSYFNLTLV